MNNYVLALCKREVYMGDEQLILHKVFVNPQEAADYISLLEDQYNYILKVCILTEVQNETYTL